MINEWTFVADCASQINDVLKSRPDLPFSKANVEGQSKGSAKRRDLTLFNKDGDIVFTGEVRLPDHTSGGTPYLTSLVQDAQHKADNAGVEYYFTWNVNSCVLWRTFEKGKAVTEREIEVIKALPANIKSRDELDSPRVQEQVTKFLERLLERCAAILKGDEPFRALPFDAKFLDIWENALYAPVTQTFFSLNERYLKDARFTRQLDDWMKRTQGWATPHADEIIIRQNLESAAKFSCYVLANKIIFYKALRRKWNKLRAFAVPESIQSGADLQKHFEAFFEDARKQTGDYETVFEGDFGDALPLLGDASVEAWRSLSRETDKFDFTRLDFEVIGQIFERMLSPTERHKFGQHFTRSEIVDLINAFCIRDANDSVLDPACGGGTFLVRAYARKRVLSNGALSHQELLGALHGVDISAYPAHLTTLNLATRDLIDNANYPLVVREDFFNIEPGQFVYHAGLGSRGGQLSAHEMPKLSAIVGNPPYIKQEAISEHYGADYKDRIRKLAAKEANGLEWSGRSDIHCYFWAHALPFLADDGWLGLLVSSTWLDTDYGFRLQNWMLDNFEVRAIFESSCEPWFEGARVKTTAVILKRQKDAKKRAANTVRFVLFEKKLEELMSFEGEDAARFAWFDALRDRIESFQGSEALQLPCGESAPVALKQGTLEGMRLRTVRQSELRRLGESAPASTSEDVAEDDEAESADDAAQVLVSAGDYKGYKWGLFLRAPDVFFELLRRGGRAFVPLHQVAEVKRGITSGCDKFFFPRDVTEKCLAAYPDPKKFHDQYGLTRSETAKVRLVEAGDKTVHAIEAKYLEPVVFNLMEIDATTIDASKLRRLIFLTDKSKDELKNTRALRYIEWGEKTGFHLGPTCATRKPWYALGNTHEREMVWSKSQQYRHIVARNPEHLLANCNLYDVWGVPGVDNKTLAAILNSTLVALWKHQFGRNAGTEGNLKTEIPDVKMMLIPDPRRTSTAIAARMGAALDTIAARNTGQLVDVDGVGTELSGELAMSDRQELDDAVLELLGVTDAKERAKLRAALYEEVTALLRDIRATERIMQKFRSKSAGRARASASSLAAELVQAAILNGESLAPLSPLEFLSPRARCDTLQVLAERGEIIGGTLFAPIAVRFDAVTIETGTLERARWVKALGECGLSGDLRVPLSDKDIAHTLRGWQESVDAQHERVRELAEEYTLDAALQKKIVAETQRLLRNAALDAAGE